MTNLLWICRPHRCISSCQSYSTFSSENLSVSDGEEGNTSDHSNSPDERANRRKDKLAEKLDEMMSQTPEIPIEISTQSDGLSDKESAVRRVKTQMSLGKLCPEECGYEVSWYCYLFCLCVVKKISRQFGILKLSVECLVD